MIIVISSPYQMAEVFNVLIGIIGVVFLLAMVFGIAFYIINAIALYGIAKNRGYDKPWLAWIPYANKYLMGAVADDINYRKGKSTSFRIWILIGSVVAGGASVIFGAVQSMRLIEMIQTMSADLYAAQALAMSFGSLIISLLSVAYAIVYYIVLYRIFVDYVPKNAVLFLVLSILFNVTEPFFLLSIRNKPSASVYGTQGTPWQQAQPYPAQPIPPAPDAQPPVQNTTDPTPPPTDGDSQK